MNIHRVLIKINVCHLKSRNPRKLCIFSGWEESMSVYLVHLTFKLCPQPHWHSWERACWQTGRRGREWHLTALATTQAIDGQQHNRLVFWSPTENVHLNATGTLKDDPEECQGWGKALLGRGSPYKLTEMNWIGDSMQVLTVTALSNQNHWPCVWLDHDRECSIRDTKYKHESIRYYTIRT